VTLTTATDPCTSTVCITYLNVKFDLMKRQKLQGS
jgi:hypothetical protein